LRPQLATWQKTIIETFIHTSLRNLLIIFSPGKSKNINLTKAISTATVTQLSKDQTLTKQIKSNFIVLCKQNHNMFFSIFVPHPPPHLYYLTTNQPNFSTPKTGENLFFVLFHHSTNRTKKSFNITTANCATAFCHKKLQRWNRPIKILGIQFFFQKSCTKFFFCFLTIPFLKRHNSITENTTIL